MSTENVTTGLIEKLQNYGHQLPTPTPRKPYSQIEWIFERQIKLKKTKETKGNYINAKRRYIELLSLTGVSHPFFLADEWDEFSLISLRQQIESCQQEGTLAWSSHTRVGIFSAIRCVMRLACELRLLKCSRFVDASMGASTSETDEHAAYSDGELAQLMDVLSSELHFSRSVIGGYVPSNVGQDPRIKAPAGRVRGYGFGVEDNAHWYFENVMGCIPIRGPGSLVGHEHAAFLRSASLIHGGLHELYRRWGVATCMGLDVLMPQVVQLAYLSGLNPSTLLLLEVDCFIDKHELTGTPFLRGWKERVKGEYNLDLALLDSPQGNVTVTDGAIFDLDIRALKQKQALQVKRTIEIILKATQPLRERLKKSDPKHPLLKRLFIYESMGPRSDGEILAISAAQTSRWCIGIAEQYGLLGDDGNRLGFNLVRFRSTKLTEMALQGRDLLEIQLVACHKDATTTMGYLSRKKIETHYRKAIHDALTKISENRHQFDRNNRVTEPQKKVIPIFKGLISDCKNVFDPPKKVRLAKSFQEGKSCNRFNMCLFCKNILVFKEHLPALVAYLNQINIALENNVHNVPNASLYENSKQVIEQLINPDFGEFDEEDIAWAKQEAVFQDILIDPLIYRGVI